MNHERRFAARPVTLEVRADQKPRIEGYAAVFYREGDPGTEYKLFDDLVERVMPTAFQEFFAQPTDCRALFNHDPNCPLGRCGNRTLSLTVDNVGLRYSIDPPDTQLGRDMLAYLGRGDVTGSSFSFRATKQSWREQGDLLVRELDGVEIFDVGPVTFPAYEGASAGVRSFGEDPEALRQAVRREADEWRRKNAKPWRPDLAARRRRLRLADAD